MDSSLSIGILVCAHRATTTLPSSIRICSRNSNQREQRNKDRLYIVSRECGSCTKCCEGWLSGVVDGEYFYPGKECKFCIAGSGCSSYESRPVDPCQTFTCAWILDESIEDDRKPEFSDAIVSVNNVNNIRFAELTPAGERFNVDTLSWFILWGLNKHGNVAWQDAQGAVFHLGSAEFSNLMNAARK